MLPASFNKFTMSSLMSFVIFTILCHSRETCAHENGQWESILLIILKFTLDSRFRGNDRKMDNFLLCAFCYILLLYTRYFLYYVLCILYSSFPNYTLHALRYPLFFFARYSILDTNFGFCILKLYYHHRVSKTIESIIFFNCFLVCPKNKILSGKGSSKH